LKRRDKPCGRALFRRKRRALRPPLLVDDSDPRFGRIDVGFGRLNARRRRCGFRLRSLCIIARRCCGGFKPRCACVRCVRLTAGIGERAFRLCKRERRRRYFGGRLRKNQRRAEDGAGAKRG